MRRFRGQFVSLMVGAALLMGEATATAGTPESVVPTVSYELGQAQMSETGTDATDEELVEARGGFLWFYYAVVGTTAVLRTCSKVDCVRLGVSAFTSISAARRYICNRKPRLRIC